MNLTPFLAIGTITDHVLDPLMLAKVRKFDYDERDEAMS